MKQVVQKHTFGAFMWTPCYLLALELESRYSPLKYILLLTQQVLLAACGTFRCSNPPSFINMSAIYRLHVGSRVKIFSPFSSPNLAISWTKLASLIRSKKISLDLPIMYWIILEKQWAWSGFDIKKYCMGLNSFFSQERPCKTGL